MRMENDTNLLVKNSEKLVGLRQVLKGIINDELRCVVLSSDCEDFVRRNIEDAVRGTQVEIVAFSSMKELGKLCGIDVAASVVGLKKSN